MTRKANGLPPVILLGGASNALSAARSLGRQGVRVFALNDDAAHVRFSRYCRLIRPPWKGNDEDSWGNFLLGPDAKGLHGAVLMACGDAGLRLVARHRDALAQFFRLEESNPAAQLRMLSKLATYQEAVKAGVLTPRFWVVKDGEEVSALRGGLAFPLLVKPVWSHDFTERFRGAKFFVAEDFEQLTAGYRKASEAGIEVLLAEMVPGGDDCSWGYHTYLDDEGRALFHLVRRSIRRFPVNRGESCYVATDWDAEVADVGLKLVQSAGLRGLAHVDFKRDPRDGRLKLIECNGRLTGATCLLTACGFDLPLFVYNRLTGRPQAPLKEYRRGVMLWYPDRDFKAFRELQKRGEMTFGQWLRSVWRPQVLPYFRWYDPAPTLAAAVLKMRIDVPVRLAVRAARFLISRLTPAARGAVSHSINRRWRGRVAGAGVFGSPGFGQAGASEDSSPGHTSTPANCRSLAGGGGA